ncbi:hypothetical protein N7468_005539 [Penicillium chermesinum]|uniref:Uncharacterized protein n=1 Tax=Penicillium chermesinum TaxID=63820 RepID=A0A9W9TNH6_9EURO|nr:uncharacterized protein N7468_005539 [Penicillium chermesinum]KAJ5232583.1 hypothetical protein N7468_005539 [Penicillium chermesinum]
MVPRVSWYVSIPCPSSTSRWYFLSLTVRLLFSSLWTISRYHSSGRYLVNKDRCHNGNIGLLSRSWSAGLLGRPCIFWSSPPRAGHHQIDSALYLTAADFAQRCSLSDLDYPVLVVLS